MTSDMPNFAVNVQIGRILKLLDQVNVRKPIRVRELVAFLASINYMGTSSLDVGIRAVTENIRCKEVCHTNSCYFTTVAADENGKPAAAPPLQPRAPDRLRRFESVRIRKQCSIRVS